MRKAYRNPKAKVISVPTNDSSLMTARALDAYMRFRAKHEGVGYTLSPKFFAEHIEQGCEKCFGVTFQDSHLMDDEEQPELFRRWKETHSPERKIYDVFMKATKEGNVPFGYYGPETCRWATQEEVRRLGLKDYPMVHYPMVHLDENGEIDCYFTETEAVITRLKNEPSH
jgi:hypothetical protein